MHVTGLITEYNPFHNGHLFHIRRAREVAGADFLIVLMSGSFVQRGAPAIFDKYSRARAALLCGADVVAEMPVTFSTASAREFASYGIALFTALGAVDSICFGSECGEIGPLFQTARLLAQEPEGFKEALGNALRQGKTYPEARAAALSSFLPGSDLLSTPNNILGIEYCQAVLRQNSPLSCLTIRREGSGYHDSSISGTLGSALAVRSALEEQVPAPHLASLVPPCTMESIKKDVPVFLNDFSSLLNYRLLTEKQPEQYAELKPELASRMRKLSPSPVSFDERIKELKSRQFTYTGISRALLHLVLGVRADAAEDLKAAGYAPYARILGFRKSAAPVLKKIKANSAIPVITKLAGAEKKLDPRAASMLALEIQSSHLYQSVRLEKAAWGRAGGKTAVFQNEYTQPVAVIS